MVTILYQRNISRKYVLYIKLEYTLAFKNKQLVLKQNRPHSNESVILLITDLNITSAKNSELQTTLEKNLNISNTYTCRR